MNTKSILLFLGLLLSIPMLYTPAQAERIRDLATVRALYQLGVRRFGMSHGAVTKVLAELEQHPERFSELNAD
mgnify:CR=1 FL=1